MEGESTVGEALLASVAALGLPIIGRSHTGRPIHGGAWPIPAISTTGYVTADGPPVVVMAGIHGDEPASVAAVLDLCARWSFVQPACPVWLVPALNPDGLAAGTKNSARDVDLNRNFAARNFVTTHKPGYDPGSAPLSEPETRAFTSLLGALSPWGVVAVHAPFACINHDGPAAAWAESVAEASDWPVRADLGYPTPGSLGSWLGVDCRLPVLTIELPPGPLAGFREQAFRALLAAVSFTPEASQ